jgi:hypothetical protein
MYHAHTLTPERARQPFSSHGVVPELAGQRHGVKVPQLLAGPDVERARVAGLAERDLAGGGAENRDVLVDRRHAVPRHADVDHAVAPNPPTARRWRRRARPARPAVSRMRAAVWPSPGQ